MPKYYAVMDGDGRVIAEGETFSECLDKAYETGIWDKAPGTGAPYSITNCVSIRGIEPKGRCLSCEVLYINGVRCHETGCPDAWKEEKRSCKECGGEFIPEERHQVCCSHNCSMAFTGHPCDCHECHPPEGD